MSDRLDELGDAEVVVVLFTAERRLRGYRNRFAPELTAVTDEPRAVYRAYGLGRAPWWRAYGWSTVKAYASLLRRGRRLHRPTEDTLQLGGDFVIGPDGRLVYVFRSTAPDDRPAVDDLIAAVATARHT